MFTGIIEATGTIKSLTKPRLEAEGGSKDECCLIVHSDKLNFNDIALGDSIAVSGVCLTVTELGESTFSADVSNETLNCTNLGSLVDGSLVNLELSLKPESRLGGHLVSGHVDGLGILHSKGVDAGSLSLVFAAPLELAHYISRKGSVCIDGISLTVNEVDGLNFTVNIIPHTAAETTMHEFEVGRQVNLEVDLISRYLERLLQKDELSKIYSDNKAENDNEGLSVEKLKASGFIK
jgi:riboflavin synthase